jgi:hypothetical protein
MPLTPASWAGAFVGVIKLIASANVTNADRPDIALSRLAVLKSGGSQFVPHSVGT